MVPFALRPVPGALERSQEHRAGTEHVCGSEGTVGGDFLVTLYVLDMPDDHRRRFADRAISTLMLRILLHYYTFSEAGNLPQKVKKN